MLTLNIDVLCYITSIEDISTVFHIGEQTMYTIGEVSRMTGLTPSGIRYYEMTGTIKPKRLNSMRIYSKRDIQKIQERRQKVLSQRRSKNE